MYRLCPWVVRKIIDCIVSACTKWYLTVHCCTNSHDDVIKWKHCPRFWLFVRGIHRSQRSVTQSFDDSFDLRLLTTETPVIWDATRSLWRHCNAQGNFLWTSVHISATKLCIVGCIDLMHCGNCEMGLMPTWAFTSKEVIELYKHF